MTNVRGGTLTIGEGNDTAFTPVELLLAAIGGCTAIDVDYITSRRAEPTAFTVTVTGDKLRDAERGNHLDNLEVTFTVRFPEGPEGDTAREALPRAAKQSHDRLCTVSRTVEAGTPVRVEVR
ncbi:OsmC family protein [Actinokineospora sp.]|uniref:OsmC family protein n=1 Tax=Actinokineospora sp. TaxID=1872133 RepID=UPI003D6B5A05